MKKKENRNGTGFQMFIFFVWELFLRWLKLIERERENKNYSSTIQRDKNRVEKMINDWPLKKILIKIYMRLSSLITISIIDRSKKY